MSAKNAYNAAVKKGWKKGYEEIVANSGNIGLIVAFARDVPGANIKRLEDIVIEYGSIQYAYYFAARVPGANISDIVNYVLVKEPDMIKQLFLHNPDLKEKYKLGESKMNELDRIRLEIRNHLKEGWFLNLIKNVLQTGSSGGAQMGGGMWGEDDSDYGGGDYGGDGGDGGD